MADDVSPIQPIGADEPTTPRIPPAPAPAPRAAAAPERAAAPVQMDDAVVREQLEHPVRAPGTTSERAQHLAGAAASAGSGQAASLNEDLPAPAAHDESEDPLAPVTAIDEDPRRRDPRTSEERQADHDMGA